MHFVSLQGWGAKIPFLLRCLRCGSEAKTKGAEEVTSGSVPNVLALEEDPPFKDAAWKSKSIDFVFESITYPRRPKQVEFC